MNNCSMLKKIIICLLPLLLVSTLCACGKKDPNTPLWEYTEISKVEILMYYTIDDLTNENNTVFPKAVIVEDPEDVEALKEIAVRVVNEGTSQTLPFSSPKYHTIFHGKDGTVQYYLAGPCTFGIDFMIPGTYYLPAETNIHNLHNGTAKAASFYLEIQEIFTKYESESFKYPPFEHYP